MKHTATVLICIFIITGGASQVSPREWSKHRSRIERSASKGSVVLSLDTIFNRGRPYAILRETRTAGALIYTLLSFAGVPLIEIPVFCEKHEEDCFLEFLFLKTRRKAECAAFGNNPEDLIVNAGLVVNDHIDSLAEMKFARKYPVGKSNPLKRFRMWQVTSVLAAVRILNSSVSVSFRPAGRSQPTGRLGSPATGRPLMRIYFTRIPASRWPNSQKQTTGRYSTSSR
jgi:hypothetical protein